MSTLQAFSETPKAKAAKLPLLHLNRFLIAASAGMAMSVLQPQAANALIVTTSNNGSWDTQVLAFSSYEDASANGTFLDKQGFLTSQKWWGDQTLANEFASLVGFGLGQGNTGQGPYFAYGYDQNTDLVSLAFVDSGGLHDSSILGSENIPIRDGVYGSGAYVGYAYATPVPAPLPILGAFAAFGFSRKLRKRIKANRSTASLTL